MTTLNIDQAARIAVTAEPVELVLAAGGVYGLANIGDHAAHVSTLGTAPETDGSEAVGEFSIPAVDLAYGRPLAISGVSRLIVACAEGETSTLIVTRIKRRRHRRPDG